ncbi:MAG: HlyD family efflux transporter periplasmic adaptor subunit [Candidatus Paracaedibacteraceae bacterium]|nr:HlyD family efflux transporter periplasmic adaptor subunit [Candidatus Paracaedibacteraceae bacterium]
MTLSRGQITRLILATFLLGLLLFVYLPRLFYTYSINAAVSARTVQIVAPIPGEITFDLPLFGQEVKKGQEIASFSNPTVDKVKLEQLSIDQKYYKERITASETEIKKNQELFDDLAKSWKTYLGSMEQRTILTLNKAEDRQQQLLASLDMAWRDYNRKKDLADRGFVSRSEFDTSKSRYQEAQEAVDQAENDIRTYLSQVEAIRQGVSVNTDGRSDYPGQKQKMDDIQMKINDISSRIDEYKVKLTNIADVKKAEEARITLLANRKVKSPVNGAIWRLFSAKGTFVEQNTPIMEILDCSNVFVDVALPERLFEKIKPGQKAYIKLNGSSTEVEGEISYVRGGSIDPRVAGLMVGLPNVQRQREIQVLVKFNEESLKQVPGDFCHVGRTGQVRFQGL